MPASIAEQVLSVGILAATVQWMLACASVTE
jgi:hypothetical protein